MNQTFCEEEILWVEEGRGIATRGRIGEQEEFFQDHFPDFPVLPGVLMLEILKRAAEYYLSKITGRQNRYALKQIKNVKFTSYLKPGDSWQAAVQIASEDESGFHCKGQLLQDQRPAASAQFILRPVLTAPHSNI